MMLRLAYQSPIPNHLPASAPSQQICLCLVATLKRQTDKNLIKIIVRPEQKMLFELMEWVEKWGHPFKIEGHL